mgnify:CR=1 FL=1
MDAQGRASDGLYRSSPGRVAGPAPGDAKTGNGAAQRWGIVVGKALVGGALQIDGLEMYP